MGQSKPDPQASEMGTVEMSLAPGGEKDPIFQGLPKSFEVQSGHSDSIVRPPEGAVALCHNNVGAYQAFRMNDLPIYGTQFHCDLTGDEARTLFSIPC